MPVIELSQEVVTEKQVLHLDKCEIYNVFNTLTKKRELYVAVPVYDEQGNFVKKLDKLYKDSQYNSMYAKYTNDTALLYAFLKDIGVEVDKMPIVGDLQN
jgi:hypothetical protein